MAKDRQKIIDTINKLRAMANDKSSPHEAEIAMIRAAKLIKKHQIDEFKELGKVDSALSEEKALAWGYKSRIPHWIHILVGGVGDYFGTRPVICYRQFGKQHLRTVVFQGFTQDVEICVELMKFYCMQFEHLYKTNCPPGMSSVQFYNGLAMRTQERLMAEKLQEEYENTQEDQASATAPGSTSNALILVKEKEIAEHFGELKAGGKMDFHMDESVIAGMITGDKVNLFKRSEIQ